MLPLKGVTVVSLEQAVAAPLASRHLADLGARVIKVEKPGTGDFARSYDRKVMGMASHFVWLNRSKESLTLDLKRAEAMQILEQLLARADVFIHNLAPGAARRLGLDSEALRSPHPRLIVCTISGYGSSGPYADRKAYDLLVQAEAGLLSITGTEESPCKAGIAIADIAGGMYAYSGILAALVARSSSGKGSAFEVSLFDSLVEWMGYPALYTRYGGSAPPRSGASHAAIAPYGPFTTADGSAVFLAIQNESEWASFCHHVLNQPGLAHDSRFRTNTGRMENRAALHALIGAVFGSAPAPEIEERLRRGAIAFARMNSVEELLKHPQVAGRAGWMDVDSPAGPVTMTRPPVSFGDDCPPGAIPRLGQHTEPILQELGFGRDQIEELRQASVI
jgi:crotonobetainyl-CoA:carnitine CoA-transferase CaiB-like acyl-CoA transferase